HFTFNVLLKIFHFLSAEVEQPDQIFTGSTWVEFGNVLELHLTPKIASDPFTIHSHWTAFCERDSSGKRASEGGTTECVLAADSPVTRAFGATFALILPINDQNGGPYLCGMSETLKRP